jgi:hypothetical protein
MPVTPARANVMDLEESYSMPGLKKSERIEWKADWIVDSAARLVVM